MKSKIVISDSNTPLVVCDWGSSNLRAYLIDSEGNTLRKFESDQGVKAMAGDKLRYTKTLGTVLNELGAGAETEIRISGMAGSKLGWVETDYIATPVTLSAFSSNSVSVTDFPNVRLFGGAVHRHYDGSLDVMRGEEVQVFGVLDRHPGARMICLPGTHSKWVTVDDEQIVSFRTYMTGDLFHSLCAESIFKEQITGREFDEESFLAGCQLAADGNGLQDLFKLRSHFVFSRITGEGFYSYLSGFLIGNEISSAKPESRVHLCSSPSLTPLYALALEQFGVETLSIDSDTATIRGHHTLNAT